MPFALSPGPSHPHARRGPGHRWSYAVGRRWFAPASLKTSRTMRFLFCRNDAATILAYLALIEAGHGALLNAALAGISTSLSKFCHTELLIPPF